MKIGRSRYCTDEMLYEVLSSDDLREPGDQGDLGGK